MQAAGLKRTLDASAQVILLKNQVQYSPLWGGGCEDHRRSGGQRRNQETLFPLSTVPSLTRPNAGDRVSPPLLQQDYIGAHRVRDQVQRPQGEPGEDARAGDARRHG